MGLTLTIRPMRPRPGWAWMRTRLGPWPGNLLVAIITVRGRHGKAKRKKNKPEILHNAKFRTQGQQHEGRNFTACESAHWGNTTLHTHQPDSPGMILASSLVQVSTMLLLFALCLYPIRLWQLLSLLLLLRDYPLLEHDSLGPLGPLLVRTSSSNFDHHEFFRDA